MKSSSQKKTIIISCLVLSIIISLFFANANYVEFTRIIEGKVAPSYPPDSSWYFETILVKNMPKDHLERCKIMIAYVDSVGLNISDLSKMPGIKHYCVSFYKQTPTTIRYFIKKDHSGRYALRDAERDEIGTIFISRCDDDSTKWRGKIRKSLGMADLRQDGYPKGVNIMLFDECKRRIPEYVYDEKNEELVRYYMELRNRRKTENNDR
jgi:hypothetical protein